MATPIRKSFDLYPESLSEEPPSSQALPQQDEVGRSQPQGNAHHYPHSTLAVSLLSVNKLDNRILLDEYISKSSCLSLPFL